MQEANDGKKLAIGTVALILAIVFFGGFLKDVAGGIFDFGKLTGQFPEWFKTAGGTSAKGGFVFALSLVPAIMLALGFVAIFERYYALYAASHWLTPVLKPLIGIPGCCSISLIASTQSTAAFQFSAGAMITNFLASFAPLLLVADKNGALAPVSIAAALGLILVFKVFGANLMRLYVKKFVKDGETEV